MTKKKMKEARKMAEEETNEKQKHKKERQIRRKRSVLENYEDRIMIERKCYDNCEKDKVRLWSSQT